MRNLVFLVGWLFATAAEADCRLERLAWLPMTTDAKGTVEVPVEISGRTVALLVDTGGISSLLTASAADRLGLERRSVPPSEMTIPFGGPRLTQAVTAPGLAFGALAPQDKRFVIVPDGRLPSGADGTMASDMLSHMDLEFDFPGHRLGFYTQNRCPGGVVSWPAAAVSRIAVEVTRYKQINLHIGVDGKDIRASFDTGTSRSVMSLELAQSLFGLTPNTPGMRALGAPGVYSYRFGKLTFGGVTVANPDIVLLSDRYSPPVRGVPLRTPGATNMLRVAFVGPQKQA